MPSRWGLGLDSILAYIIYQSIMLDMQLQTIVQANILKQKPEND